jgi:hypothetical protein
VIFISISHVDCSKIFDNSPNKHLATIMFFNPIRTHLVKLIITKDKNSASATEGKIRENE